MGALDDARAHLAKAREFREAAEITLDLEMPNAATSAAELTRSGPAGSAVAQTFSRLLRLKPVSQYQVGSVARADAKHAVDWATRMLEAATGVVHS